jgi:hypothetical protein
MSQETKMWCIINSDKDIFCVGHFEKQAWEVFFRYQDLKWTIEEAKNKGFRALKCNIVLLKE